MQSTRANGQSAQSLKFCIISESFFFHTRTSLWHIFVWILVVGFNQCVTIDNQKLYFIHPSIPIYKYNSSKACTIRIERIRNSDDNQHQLFTFMWTQMMRKRFRQNHDLRYSCTYFHRSHIIHDHTFYRWRIKASQQAPDESSPISTGIILFGWNKNVWNWVCVQNDIYFRRRTKNKMKQRIIVCGHKFGKNYT